MDACQVLIDIDVDIGDWRLNLPLPLPQNDDEDIEDIEYILVNILQSDWMSYRRWYAMNTWYLGARK